MKRVTTILFLMLLICVHTAAQQKVKLEVLEKGTEQPIIAANVIYADNEALRNPQYAITNTSGQAELKLPSKGICYYKVTYILKLSSLKQATAIKKAYILLMK